MVKLNRINLTKNTMPKQQLHQIKQEVKEKMLAKIRFQWFKEYKKCKNVSKVCRKYGISRSMYYYWKKRLDLPSCGKWKGHSKVQRLIAYSRKPKTNPKAYPEEIVKLRLLRNLRRLTLKLQRKCMNISRKKFLRISA